MSRATGAVGLVLVGVVAAGIATVTKNRRPRDRDGHTPAASTVASDANAPLPRPSARADRKRRLQADLARLAAAAAMVETSPSIPAAPPGRLGLAAEDLVPVPLDQRPTPGELAALNAEAAAERARAPRPSSADRDLLIGLLAAVKQVKEDPVLRAGLANAYLQEIRGLDEAEETEARRQLLEAQSTL